ncbi:MAG: RagB/SusD family nutrient uptake outer membrane protein, partial [Candidatus Nephrothrix sp. EaCA]
NKILKERFLELAYEGHRWHDLKRMLSPEAMIQWLQNEKYKNKEGRWVSFPYGSNLTPHRLLLPIPQVALDTNPNLVQNPGY